jgi:hypothetical protein
MPGRWFFGAVARAYTASAIEINAKDSGILSGRWNDVLIASVLLCSMPVEQVGFVEFI